MNEKITGVVLAGGLGRRMGGVDKGLQLLRGRPMVAWVLERLAPQVDAIFINANRNARRYAEFGYPVLPDQIPDFAGPLAGLHAALSTAATPLVVTVPCDSPYLPANLVTRLRRALTDETIDLAVARTLERTHPVFCLARRTLLPHLTTYLADGGRRIDRWYSTLKVSEVAFNEEAAAFENINTAEELAMQEQEGK